MKRHGDAEAPAGAQSIEELKKRYDQLNKRKIQAETNLGHANRQLDELKRDARDNYGTDDLGELQSKLAEMKAENERKRAAYQTSLEQIETRLAEVERDFAASGSSEAAS
jgi:hypothetical protein